MKGNVLEYKSRPLRYGDDRPFRMHLLLHALLDPNACVLLGAGASYGLVSLRPSALAPYVTPAGIPSAGRQGR
jgi:hypothetical protein